MKFNTIKHILVFVFLLTIFALPILVHGEGTDLINPLSGTTAKVSFEEAINRIITSALGISGVLALIAFIWGGINWMISGGDPSKVKKGRDMMIWAVWGLVIIFSSFAILTAIFGALGDDGSGATGNIGPVEVPSDQ